MNNSLLFISYKDIIENYQNFKKVDYEGFNRFDNPNFLYWRPVFYFTDDHGLLGLSDMTFDDKKNQFEEDIENTIASFGKSYFSSKKDVNNSIKSFSGIKDTAYHYLLLNDEKERVYMLKKFIMLLSNISQKAPWYFTELTGLDGALERKTYESDFKIEDQRKQITIKCLPDAYDNRIGTLLDLYRAICFSYSMKKEVVPANLRKFNMGILIFPQPQRGKGGKNGTSNAKIGVPLDGQYDFYIPSCKLIELHNCEFDYNSAKSAYSSLKSEEPLQPEYTITISFDDAYEKRYDELMQYVITDFITTDIAGSRGEESDENYDYETLSTTSYEDKRNIKLSASSSATDDERKQQFVNTDYERSPYQISMTETKEDEESRIINDIGGKGPFSSMVTNAVDKVASAVKIPSLDLSENLHDHGTTQNYGVYEYLNRVSGSDSLIGSAVSQAAGSAAKFMKDTVTTMFLGNIYSLNSGDILSDAGKLINGDFKGAAADIQRQQEKPVTNPNLDGKRLPGYYKDLVANAFGAQSKKETEDSSSFTSKILPGYKQIQEKGRQNSSASIRNNL